MSWQGTGADIGTMVTGASALTATYVWIQKQVRERRAAKAARSYRFWNGLILREGVFTGYVRLVADAESPPERVTLDVVNPDGSSNPQMAYGLRQIIEADGMLSRSPSVEQQAFLDDLRHNRFGAKDGYPVN